MAGLRNGKANVTLHGLTERARAQVFIEADLQEKIEHVRCELNVVAFIGEKASLLFQTHCRDLDLDVVGQLAKHQDRVDAAHKFGSKCGGHLGQNVFFDLGKVEVLRAKDIGCAQIGRENGVKTGKIKGLVDTARDPCRVEDGETNIRDFGFGLFDFIEEEDAFPVMREDMAESSQPAGVITYEFGQCVVGFEFRHVETQRLLSVEKSARQDAGRFRFADAGRTEEYERTFGPAGRGKTIFADSHALDHGWENVILAANQFAQISLQEGEPLQG